MKQLKIPLVLVAAHTILLVVTVLAARLSENSENADNTLGFGLSLLTFRAIDAPVTALLEWYRLADLGRQGGWLAIFFAYAILGGMVWFSVGIGLNLCYLALRNRRRPSDALSDASRPRRLLRQNFLRGGAILVALVGAVVAIHLTLRCLGLRQWNSFDIPAGSHPSSYEIAAPTYEAFTALELVVAGQIDGHASLIVRMPSGKLEETWHSWRSLSLRPGEVNALVHGSYWWPVAKIEYRPQNVTAGHLTVRYAFTSPRGPEQNRAD